MLDASLAGRSASRSQGHLKCDRPAENPGLTPLDRLLGQVEVRVTSQERAKNNPRFGAREGCAEAVMNPASEGQRFVVGPVDVETIRIGEPRWVTVRTTKGQDESVACGNEDASDGRVLPCSSQCRCHR